MDFLPFKMNGKEVYAGFGPRFGATLIDSLIFIPVTIFFWRMIHQSVMAGILMTVSFTFLGSFYPVFFNARFGATLGKMVLNIKVVKPDGSAIGWGEACKRQSVLFVFSMIGMCEQLWVFTQLNPAKYAALSWREQGPWMRDFRPDWFFIVTILQTLWMLSEIIVFFSNKRRRAVHDFIAGTVVIHKPFSQKMGSTNNRAENEAKNRLQA